VLSLLRRHPGSFWNNPGRLSVADFLLVHFPAVTDDSAFTPISATNWLQHGIYGITQLGKIVPTDERLPGYPGFLAVIFALFGPMNFRAV